MIGLKNVGVVLAVGLLGADSAACDIGTRSWNQAEAEARAAKAAKFRWTARDAYKYSQQESCEPSALVYAVELAEEIAALRAFETEAGSGGVGFQLSIARTDVAHRHLGCWADYDPRFTQRHVAWARERLTEGLETLGELAPTLPAEAPRDSLAPEVSADFRTRVAVLVGRVNPMCRISSRGDDGSILAPARAALDAFEHRLDGSPYALHFAIAEADVLFLHSVTLVECAEPRRESPDVIRAEIEARVVSEIAEIEAGMNPPSGR